MKIAIALLVVCSAVFMAAAEEKAEEDPIAFLKARNMPVEEVGEDEPEFGTEDEQHSDSAEVEKRAKKKWIVDRLSYISCRYILSYGLCYKHAILRYLCPALCRCKNRLSRRSCLYLKKYGYCKKNVLTRSKCRYTCKTCIRKFLG
ncbi:uncharacterized protein LOC110233244 [Exaiptasia diaphana]|uniref:ShKT domain-containing protein n=1 Tax=Exaiptasia diaphana TaxID=2652724 RepID=A0A913WU59_EXADI|nr:uncharacterized protein LOC110233244 [Exaiptasia diaphana]KXJ20986.1 hypothetical protein AC249_AIPGENE14095 [Exaiptasia diaphana]